MKFSKKSASRVFKTALCFILLYNSITSAQINPQIRRDTRMTQARQRVLIDTSPKTNPMVSDRIKINDGILSIFNSVDTVWDLTPYLQSKASCDYEKTMDNDGCIIVTYTDGFKKTICGGSVIDVTLSGGKKYVRRMGQSIKHEVMRIPPPSNPGPAEAAYTWLVQYNETLLNEIKKYLVTNDAINKYSQNEKVVCKGMFYKQIEYRTIFLEEFLKAK